MTEVPTEASLQRNLICSRYSNKNRPATQLGFRVRLTSTPKTTGAEGIAFDKESISKNTGERTMAKVKLNSIRVKWTQNQNKTQTMPVTSVKVIRTSDKSGY